MQKSVFDASTFTDRNKTDVLNEVNALQTPAFFDKEQVWQMLKSQHFHNSNTTFYRRIAYLVCTSSPSEEFTIVLNLTSD